MKKHSIQFWYSIAVSLIILFTAFSTVQDRVEDLYPVFQNPYIYGLSADYKHFIGKAASCSGMAECARTICQVFGQNESIAHVVVDPINEGQRPNCTFYEHWFARMQDDEYLKPLFYLLLSTSVAFCLRLLFGILGQHSATKWVPFVTKFLFFGEKLLLLVSLILLAQFTKHFQYAILAIVTLIADTSLHCISTKSEYATPLLAKV